MPDRENVIKGLAEISEYARAKADIAGIGKGKEVFDGWYRAAEDALALLREQEPVKPKWVSVKDRMPEEKPSIFNRFHGTAKWKSAMWRYNSDPVIVAVKFPDGTGRVTIGETHDGVFRSTVSGCLPHEVTHWMPLPEMPEVVKDGN